MGNDSNNRALFHVEGHYASNTHRARYPAAIRELQSEGLMHQFCRHRTRPYANNRIESDHRSVKRRLRAMQGPRSTPQLGGYFKGLSWYT
jgi:transposase-like protein